MTNLYLPKEGGTTIEIDLIIISETAIYIFKSKNYSGWIFGDERYKNWIQTLKNKQKNQFFNPIWRDKGHGEKLKGLEEEFARVKRVKDIPNINVDEFMKIKCNRVKH